jgi:acyl-CoA thioester hydrolase
MHRLFRQELIVPDYAIDSNRHVNNVIYVQWMQDIAVAHAAATGCTAAADAIGASWYARSHHIDYLRAAFEGERLFVETWIVDVQKVRSRRRYRFLRAADLAVLARAESEWIFVDADSAKPRGIPVEVAHCFEAIGEADPDIA